MLNEHCGHFAVCAVALRAGLAGAGSTESSTARRAQYPAPCLHAKYDVQLATPVDACYAHLRLFITCKLAHKLRSHQLPTLFLLAHVEDGDMHPPEVDNLNCVPLALRHRACV